MAILGKLAGLVGGALGSVFGPLGAIVGTKAGNILGNAASKAISGGGKSSSGGSSQTEYFKPSTMSLDDIRSSSSALSVLGRRSEPTKVAQTAKVPGVPGVLEDPWKPMYDWWEDLGGEPGRIGPIDETRMP